VSRVIGEKLRLIADAASKKLKALIALLHQPPHAAQLLEQRGRKFILREIYDAEYRFGMPIRSLDELFTA
jgi:hypothetical protein